MALRAAREAGRDIKGATAYVTLEPCSHVGTTPPCTLALKEAGIARVVCGVRDPNPAIDGRGIAFLRASGIKVFEGVLEAECARAQDHFLTHIFYARPFVTLKLAASLDGRIAASDGTSQWISGEAARAHVHLLRADHDAVLCGVETVLQDNARFNRARHSNEQAAAAYRSRSEARLAGFDGAIWNESLPLLVAVGKNASAGAREEIGGKNGSTVEIDRTPHGLDLHQLMRELYAREYAASLSKAARAWRRVSCGRALSIKSNGSLRRFFWEMDATPWNTSALKLWPMRFACAMYEPTPWKVTSCFPATHARYRELATSSLQARLIQKIDKENLAAPEVSS
jgi:riboflavin biosynthesis protein RibD